jgi:hypothetical protein
MLKSYRTDIEALAALACQHGEPADMAAATI